MKRPKPNTILVDSRNWASIKDRVRAEISAAGLAGLDIETEDSRRHEGLNRLMQVDDEGHKSSTKKLLFDTNRTTITGFSVYADDSDTAYYINLAHADVENRVPWTLARELLDCKRPEASWVCHNAPFELTMFRKCLGLKLDKVICTMQLAVTAFNDDTYSREDFIKPGLGGIERLMPQIIRAFATFQGNGSNDMDDKQSDLFFKVVAKESKAEHSWIGYMKTMTWTFGLKKLSKRFLGYTQTTFEEVLNGRAHMGQLTGEEVAEYGADDAWVCMHLFHELLAYLAQTNAKAIPTFFSQENPMIHVYSDVWADGVRIDIKQVLARQLVSRKQYARTLAELKAEVRKMLPFPQDVHEKLVKYDPKGYGKEGTAERYRHQVETWAKMADAPNAFEQIYQTKNPLGKQWGAELNRKESKGLSINYYQVKRCILLDLCRCSFQLNDGKPASDADAIDTMEERWKKKGDGGERGPAAYEPVLKIIELYKKLAKIEQVNKLFINSYLNLTDPDTGKVYPTLNSLLNSRRMALATPNLSQLPKYDENAFVRSFFLADEDDHIIISADWASIELVLIGDRSGDPGFAAVFGQLPFGDLHSETAAFLQDLSVLDFKQRPTYKEERRDLGKVPNFGYWYSGALGQAAKAMNWGSEKMWEATDKYRQRFPVAEAWRVGVIQKTRETGIVHLPDGHTRIRYESTYDWAQQMRAKWARHGDIALKFGEQVIKKIQTRSGNQAVNSEIQGTCATLAKRAILRIREKVAQMDLRARFMFPVHDELVFSVHKYDALPFIRILRQAMCEGHEDIVTRLKLDCAVAVGFNYLGWDAETNPTGQIELDECSKLPIFGKEKWGTKLDESDYTAVIDYLYAVRAKKEEEVTA
jgi:DNA polymerase I-like protein with 3'-5' exonuclease and polymerase domains